jgi:hypothetical protein
VTPDDSRDPLSPNDAPSSGPGTPDLPRWARRTPSGDEFSDERMAAYFGPKWEKVYRRKLAPFLEDASFVPTWNWAAALASPAWFLYRKLYLPFTVFFLLPGFVFRWLTGSDAPQTVAELSKPENEWLQVMSVAVFLSSAIAAGGTANWLLFRRARAASRLVSMQGVPAGEALDLMRRVGGVNRPATTLFVALMVAITLMQFGG